MSNYPLVNICVTTYNREKYIAQTIESCLIQKTNFDFNIIISDDGSTDNTIGIIEEYRKRFPKCIDLLTTSKNKGLMANSIKILKATTAKYVALCDGDDYWIDENKLQIQVDFLESNSDFALCFTNSMILNDETGEQRVAKINIWDVAETAELIKHNSLECPKYGEEINSPGHTSSLLFRNHLIKEFPTWYSSCYFNDESLFLMLSKYGKAKFINIQSSVYRVNPSGISSANFSFERDINGRIRFYKDLNTFFEGKHKRQIAALISQYNLKLAKIFKRKKKFKNLVYTLCQSIFYKIKSI